MGATKVSGIPERELSHELRVTVSSHGNVMLWLHDHDGDEAEAVAQGHPDVVFAAAEVALSKLKSEAIRLRGLHK